MAQLKVSFIFNYDLIVFILCYASINIIVIILRRIKTHNRVISTVNKTRLVPRVSIVNHCLIHLGLNLFSLFVLCFNYCKNLVPTHNFGTAWIYSHMGSLLHTSSTFEGHIIRRITMITLQVGLAHMAQVTKDLIMFVRRAGAAETQDCLAVVVPAFKIGLAMHSIGARRHYICAGLFGHFCFFGFGFRSRLLLVSTTHEFLEKLLHFTIC